MCELYHDDYGDTAQVWKWHRVRKCRKDHRCHECRTTIRKGTSYWRHSAVFDGTAQSSKVCLKCRAARVAFYNEHSPGIDASVGSGEFAQDLRECVATDEPSRKRWGGVLQRFEERGQP